MKPMIPRRWMMEHSKKFNKVKNYYDRGLWSKKAVRNAVGRWITADEYTEITGDVYIVVEED